MRVQAAYDDLHCNCQRDTSTRPVRLVLRLVHDSKGAAAELITQLVGSLKLRQRRAAALRQAHRVWRSSDWNKERAWVTKLRLLTAVSRLCLVTEVVNFTSSQTAPTIDRSSRSRDLRSSCTHSTGLPSMPFSYLPDALTGCARSYRFPGGSRQRPFLEDDA